MIDSVGSGLAPFAFLEVALVVGNSHRHVLEWNILPARIHSDGHRGARAKPSLQQLVGGRSGVGAADVALATSFMG